MDSECALSAVAFAVIFTLDHVSPSCFTVLSFLTTFVATRRCRCLLRSIRVNVMPERLLFVISGILAGGIPGFCIELCWLLVLIPSDLAPGVFCCGSLFCFLLGAILIMTHKMSSCVVYLFTYVLGYRTSSCCDVPFWLKLAFTSCCFICF